MEKVTVYGAGYVGLVTAACLAEIGHSVTCVDVNAEKLAQLKQFICPIHEPGLDTLIRKHGQKSLHFDQLTPAAIEQSDIHFITVGTPSSDDGTVDLRFIKSISDYLGRHIKQNAIVVNKSTSPPGTHRLIQRLIQKHLAPNVSVSVVSNPEFLREGEAINDFLKPERIIIGSDCKSANAALTELYRPITSNSKHALIFMSPSSAELTKYAANAFLASKISFINEIAALAESVGADIDDVSRGMGSDSRIGRAFLNAGCGYGGSCFPKDVDALISFFDHFALPADILKAVRSRNSLQQTLLFRRLNNYFNNQLSEKHIAVWGLSFKPNTDDIRCATSGVLIELLLNQGAIVHAYDPMANQNIARQFNHHNQLMLFDDKYDCLSQCDALLVATEWQEFISADAKQAKSINENLYILDGRNCLSSDFESLGMCISRIGKTSAAEMMESTVGAQ